MLRQKYFYLFLISLSIFLSSVQSQSRVFDFKKENLATYLKGTGGTISLGTGLFDTSSGTGTTYSAAGMALCYSGEIGLLFGYSNFIFTAGVALVRPKTIEGLVGTAPNGVDLFSIKSDFLAVVPSIGVEYAYYLTSTFKGFVAGSAGLATIDFGNTYTFTAAGATQTSLTDYKEEGGGTAYVGTFAAGMETLFSDNVTFVFEVGYRYFRVEDMSHKIAVSDSFLGAASKGDAIVNADGNKKIFDLSGPFAGASFRFYIDVF